MPLDPDTGIIAHAIQLAIAPVFLLTGIAALLGVMAQRLARVIDRARSVEATWPGMDAKAQAAARGNRNLERRRRVCSWSINYCTPRLLICLVIVALFVGILATNLKWLAGALFVAAMVALMRAHLVPARSLRHTHNEHRPGAVRLNDVVDAALALESRALQTSKTPGNVIRPSLPSARKHLRAVPARTILRPSGGDTSFCRR